MILKIVPPDNIKITCRVVVLESHPLIKLGGTLTNDDGADLYILAGHEASY